MHRFLTAAILLIFFLSGFQHAVAQDAVRVRVGLQVLYTFEAGQGDTVFDDAQQLNASGDQGCSHEWWHKFNESKKNDALRAHAHMKMREVAYFLHQLNDKNSLEANDRTIMENSMITISTESGDGRHNDVKRELSGVFHAITGANGRFKTGQIMDVEAEGIDVYNTMLRTMGVKDQLGPDDRDNQTIDRIRA